SAGVSQNSVGSNYTDYQYDACRTPFRVTEDYLWFGNASAQSYSTKTSNFFSAIGAVSIVDGYHLDGTPHSQLPALAVSQNPGFQSAVFVGPAGVGGMISRTYQQYMDDTYSDLVGSTLLVAGTYYDESWTVMSLLMLSDNFLDYSLYNQIGTPTFTRTSTPTNLPTHTSTPSLTFTPTPMGTLPTSTPTPSATPIYVNCAGPQTVASGGLTWLADQAYLAGSWGYLGGAVGNSGGPMANTLDPNLYLSERYAASFQYVFTLPASSFNVTLKFAETLHTGTGQRVFSIVLGPSVVLNNFDIYQSAGGKNIAYDRTFPVTTTGAPLTISFNASVDNATIQAIGITQQTPPPTATPTITPTSASPTGTFTPTRTPTSTPTSTPTL
ncbi:MAG TPA: malectin domain-containing carbohydrate-binding protein, partial [bacterium]